MDDLDYFTDGSWPASDVAYRDYAAYGGPQASGPQRGMAPTDTVWQRLADGPWSPPAQPVAAQGYDQGYDQGYLPPGQRPGTPSGGWPSLPPDSRPRPPARETWDGPTDQDLFAGYDFGYDAAYGAAQNRRPRDSRPYDQPRNTQPPSAQPRADRPRNDRPRTDWPDDEWLEENRSVNTGPRPRPAPDSHRSTGGTSLLAGPAPTTTGPMRRTQTAPQPAVPREQTPPPAAYGKRLPEWLPYGNRLVLLPKEDTDDDAPDREHRDVSGGWLRPAVFGAMDGLVTNASLIAGIGGGGGGHGAIVLTGMAGLIAGAFSMATGEYISVKSQNELTLAEVDLERRQHARDRNGKLDRLTQVFIGKGVSPNLAEAVARQISADPERAVETHVREELGIDPDDLPSPKTAAIASLMSFTVGALIPLSPFLVGIQSLPTALVLSGLFAFGGGAAVARLTGRPQFLGGLRQFVAAFLGTGAAFFIGHLIGGHVV